MCGPWKMSRLALVRIFFLETGAEELGNILGFFLHSRHYQSGSVVKQ